MSEKTASQQIDDIIAAYGGWKGDTIRRLRSIILAADSGITEDIKWKMKTRPEGLPVWSHNGIVCFVETWKDNIKLIFFKGAELTDTEALFNARLQSSTVRAIEIHEGETIAKEAITDLVAQAVGLNAKAV